MITPLQVSFNCFLFKFQEHLPQSRPQKEKNNNLSLMHVMVTSLLKVYYPSFSAVADFMFD